MTGLSMVLVVLLGQAPARDAGELVRQLGSARYAERESAAAALEAMGLAALPALRAVGDSKDPEVRRRAAAVADRIERIDRERPTTGRIERIPLDRPSMVRLDVAARSLDSVIAGFGSPSPARLAWHPDTPEAVRRRPVTIREPAPLPFWAAIDRLCRAGGLRYVPGSPGGPGTHWTPEFRLYLTPGTWDSPRADSGPFRLECVAITHSRHVNLVPNAQQGRGFRFSGPRSRPFGERGEDFRITMRLLAEPRMLITQVGNALIAEAVDDRGQSLLPGPAPYTDHSGVGQGTPQACVTFSLNLKHPARAGKVIKRLKLTIPVEVEALEPDRIEIRLADAMGKPVRHGRTTIEVISVGFDSQGHQRVKLKLTRRQEVPGGLAIDPRGNPAPAAAQPAQPEVSPNVIQVLDQEGRQFPWHVHGVRGTGPEVTAELMMWPEGGIAIPVPAGRGVVPGADRETAVPAVLYHTEVARRVIPVTFEFHDVPLP